MSFRGFSRETFRFFEGLAENNNKAWFDGHRKEYEKFLKEPLYDLATDVGAYMQTVDPAFDVTPSRAVARINRDIRFSHDKSPYKTNLWASWVNKSWDEAPGFYFEVGIDAFGFGMGFYQNKRETILRFEGRIADETKRFKEITSFLCEGKFKILGEKYKKPASAPVSGFEDWFGFKSVYVGFSSHDLEEIMDPGFSGQLIGQYKKIAGLYNFFMELRSEQ